MVCMGARLTGQECGMPRSLAHQVAPSVFITQHGPRQQQEAKLCRRDVYGLSCAARGYTDAAAVYAAPSRCRRPRLLGGAQEQEACLRRMHHILLCCVASQDRLVRTTRAYAVLIAHGHLRPVWYQQALLLLHACSRTATTAQCCDAVAQAACCPRALLRCWAPAQLVQVFLGHLSVSVEWSHRPTVMGHESGRGGATAGTAHQCSSCQAAVDTCVS